MSSNNFKYYHSVDWLRGITALIVALYHFFNYSDANGSLFAEQENLKEVSTFIPSVVLIFFLLSGFVIPMAMKRQNFQLNKLGSFFLRRWLRLELPYIVSVFIYLMIPFIWSLYNGNSYSIDGGQLVSNLTYTAALFDYSWYNDIYWTLAIEFQYYLLIGFLFPLFISENKTVRYLSLIAFSTTGIFIDGMQYVFVYAPVFVMGTLLFNWMYEEKKNFIDPILIAACLFQTAYSFDWVAPIYLLFALLIIQLKISPKNYLSKLGKIAYSFYLIHGAIGGTLLYFLNKLDVSWMINLLIVGVVTLVSILGSYLYYRSIEVPTLKLSKKVDYSK